MIKHCDFCGDKEIESSSGIEHYYDVYAIEGDVKIAACYRCANLAINFVKIMINEIKLKPEVEQDGPST